MSQAIISKKIKLWVHQEAKKGVYATGCALRTNRLHPSILFKSPFRNTPRPWIKPSANKQAPKSVGGTRGKKWEAKQPPQHSPAVTIMQSAFQMEWPHALARLAWWRRAADEWVKCRLIFTARCCALRTPKKEGPAADSKASANNAALTGEAPDPLNARGRGKWWRAAKEWVVIWLAPHAEA
jgi:hypothetical protein